MDRRSFGKLLAGTVTVAGIPHVSAAGSKTSAAHTDTLSAAATMPQPHASSLTGIPQSGGSDAWELVVLDAFPAHMTETGGTAAADLDGDGKTELIIVGNGSMLWYRPSTAERGVIVQGRFGVGIALEDVDGDGRLEIVTAKGIAAKPGEEERWSLCWYKGGSTISDPWKEYVLDPLTVGNPHDVVFGDLDGDGKRELVVNAMYCEHPGLFAYKSPADPRQPWKKQMIQTGRSAEGTATGDLDGDGRDEVVSGPYWFSAPQAGPFAGQLWEAHALAPDFREMCRAKIIDVNGDGILDVVLVEDEYPDGRLSWFENRLKHNPQQPWLQHPIDANLDFSHTLQAWHDPKTKHVHLLAAEMNAGGWLNPYNWEARLIDYTSADGAKWQSEILYQGEGTHEAVRIDLDNSGMHVIFGHAAQVVAKKGYMGWVQMFRPRNTLSPLGRYKHVFVDRQKPYTGVDILAADVDGDGRKDIVCGAWWYKNPGWERHSIPGVAQIIAAYDIDKDGRLELIGLKPKSTDGGFYNALSSNLVWLKSVDLGKDLWEEHVIGTGDGDWPHGNVIAPLLPGGRLALVCGYHDHTTSPPQIFEIPADPTQPWPKRIIANIPYGEEMVACDLDGDGKLDVVAGPYWLENTGDGNFEPHLLIEPQYAQFDNQNAISRIAIMDVNGNGRPDILFTVEDVDWNNEVRKAFFSPVGWLENTGSPRDKKFNLHFIDRIRSPHSISVADLDGDGELEVIVGEHDPFHPYRSKCRLYAYKKDDPQGVQWSRFPLDNRFEHHDGAKAVELTPGKLVIVSHGWMEQQYVHIWEQS
jgi:hypothetical protein